MPRRGFLTSPVGVTTPITCGPYHYHPRRFLLASLPPPMRSSLPPPPLPVHAQQGSVASALRALPPGARPTDVWRSAAFLLLRLNPKECEALALVFEDESVFDETRGLILDILAGGGTFECQVVIRRLLALSVARRSNRTFAGFVQRLAMVECPDGPTLRFLMSVYAESRGEPHDVRAACAYALGAAAGQALTAGDPDAAIRASDVLRRDLQSATAIIEKCALLTALGNVGFPSDVMVVTRFAQDPEPPVRSAAAIALRKMAVPDATAQLVALLADPQVKVAQSALHALADHKLSDDELERLAELVLGGRTSLAIDARVLRLLVAQRPSLTACPGRAVAIENALRLLLGRVEAAAAIEPTGSGERRAAIAAPVIAQSGSVRAMPAARPHPPSQSSHPPPAMPPPPAPFRAAVPAAPVPVPVKAIERPTAPLKSTPRAPATEIGVPPLHPRVAPASAINAIAATVVDQPPFSPSGSYRMVYAGDSPDAVRARMIQMGLDPNARISNIPAPPRFVRGR